MDIDRYNHTVNLNLAAVSDHDQTETAARAVAAGLRKRKLSETLAAFNGRLAALCEMASK